MAPIVIINGLRIKPVKINLRKIEMIEFLRTALRFFRKVQPFGNSELGLMLSYKKIGIAWIPFGAINRYILF